MVYNDIRNPKELLEYMSENIIYGFVSNDGKIYDDPSSEDWKNNWYENCIIQDGNSLINTKHGNCWDQVELERKWFSENNYNFETIFIWFETENPSNKLTHSFLVYEDNDKYYWFEHSFCSQRGIYEFNNKEELIETVKKKYLDAIIEKNIVTKEDYMYMKSYEFDEPERNLGAEEYINHVINKRNHNK